MISIVLATYNGSNYIIDQLESIFNQTLKDFEIIVIDDASTDNTVELIKEFYYSNKFSNYKLIQNDKNIGATCSFEKSVLISKGKYISFSDQDDFWMNNKLELLKSKIETGSYDLVYSQSLLLKGETKTKKLYPSQNLSSDLFIRFQHNNARGASMLVKREYLLKLLPFSRHDLYDKWIYFYTLMFSKIGFVEEPLDYYRTHATNVIGTNFRYRNKEDLINKINSRILFYNDLKSILPADHPNKLKYSGEIDKIIFFFSNILSHLKRRHHLKALKSFLQMVLFRDFSIIEKVIYFYYLIIK